MDTYDAVDSDFKSSYHEENTQANYMLNQVSYADTRDTKGAVEQEDYGADGYLNHLHINYWGGDDGQSYLTGPESDITFLDIIQPTLLEGHV